MENEWKVGDTLHGATLGFNGKVSHETVVVKYVSPVLVKFDNRCAALGYLGQCLPETAHRVLATSKRGAVDLLKARCGEVVRRLESELEEAKVALATAEGEEE